MASSYIPEKTYVVCTSQLGSSYRELLADNGKREVATFRKEERALLTVADKKLNEDFTCKTSWGKGLTSAAFGGGVGLGVGLGASALGATLSTAAAVSVVPVVGWIVGGVIAIGAIGYAIYNIANSPKCSGALGNELSQWKLYHASVKIHKHNAVLSCSILSCGEGGVLMPFISATTAQNAASSISSLNKRDIGMSFIASGLGGLGLGGAGVLAITSIGAAFWFLAGTGLAVAIGEHYHHVINWVGDKWVESESTDRYIEIQTAKGQSPVGDKSLLDYIKGATNPISDIRKLIVNQKQILAAMKENGASKEAIAEFKSAIAEAERSGFGKKNPDAQKVLDNIDEGKYGDKIKYIFTNKSNNRRGMNRGENYDKAIQQKTTEIKSNNKNILRESKNSAKNVFGLAQPFISAVFDRKTLLKALEAQESSIELDAVNGTSVVSAYY